jgi:hypothetical protein
VRVRVRVGVRVRVRVGVRVRVESSYTLRPPRLTGPDLPSGFPAEVYTLLPSLAPSISPPEGLGRFRSSTFASRQA